MLSEPSLLFAKKAKLPRGVAPQLAKKYTKSKFRCLDGKGQKMSASVINDDFCDCEDGSDEPGTSACAGTGVMFFCVNEGSVSRLVYASRVGDGICDCCDGSDELALAERTGQALACTNFCAEDGKIEAAKLEKRAEVVRRGVEEKRKIATAAKSEGKLMREERERLEAEFAQLEEKVVAAARRRAAEAKAAPKAVASERPADVANQVLPKDSAIASPATESAPAPPPAKEEAAAGASAFSEGRSQVSEYVKWMEGFFSSPAAAPEPASAVSTTVEDSDEKLPDLSNLTAEQRDMEELEIKRRQVYALDRKMKALASLGKELLGYASLNGKTLAIKKDEFTYKVAFFEYAVQEAQEPTYLGFWAGFTSMQSARFMGGAGCWMGPPRSLHVTFECGESISLLDVTEPSKCLYAATVVHPGACDADELATLTLETRIATPHDEL